MLQLTICLLFITQTFINGEHVHDASSNLPDIISLLHPNYKISYIYEQKKVDDISQVEHKEEEIGTYLQFEPASVATTTEALQDFADITMNHEHHVSNKTSVHEKHHHNHKHKEVASTLAPLPPPPELPEASQRELSQFPFYYTDMRKDNPTDFSPKEPSPRGKLQEEKEILKNAIPEFHSVQPHVTHGPRINSNRHNNRRVHISPTTTEDPAKVEAHTNGAPNTEKHHHPSPSTHEHHHGHHASSKSSPVVHKTHTSPGFAHQPVYRGSHKFSWDDAYDMHAPTKPKVSSLKENFIPSIPTLSPWYDGYGK